MFSDRDLYEDGDDFREQRQQDMEARRVAEIRALKDAAAAVDRRLGEGTALRILGGCKTP